MDRQLYGPPGLASSSDLAAVAREWVEESCARQGLAVKIADPRVLADVGSLLGYAQGPRRRPGRVPASVKRARAGSRVSGRSD
jgi:hypothetical protein